MDTVLYIILAAALMAFQIFNEKQKKEEKRRSSYKQPQRDESQDPHFHEVKITAPVYEPLDIPVSKLDTLDYHQEESNEPTLAEIYDSAKISDHEKQAEDERNAKTVLNQIDPKLLILYSEIMKPKFQD